MSKRDGRTDLRSLRDAERAELAWLLARENDPHAPPPFPEIAADYARIEDLLGSLPSGASDESWQEDVLRALAAIPQPARPWWRRMTFRWTMAGALAMAAAVTLLMLRPRAPELEVAIRHTGATRGGDGEVAVGDHLVVTARPHEAGDLRVYRSDGKLVARCPKGPGCRGGSHGEQTLDLTLDAPVQYQVIFVDGAGDALPDGSLDAYVDAARAANARIAMYPPIDVH